MVRPDKLSNYPYVRVRVRCRRCNRNGDLSLARLAQRYGADTSLWNLLLKLTHDCPRRRRPGGKLYAPCYAQLVDIENGRPPDLPPGYRVIPAIEGAKPAQACGPEPEDQSSQDVRTRRSNPSS